MRRLAPGLRGVARVAGGEGTDGLLIKRGKREAQHLRLFFALESGPKIISQDFGREKKPRAFLLLGFEVGQKPAQSDNRGGYHVWQNNAPPGVHFLGMADHHFRAKGGPK